MARTHLVEEVLCSLLTPPIWRVAMQILQDILKHPSSTRRIRELFNSPVYVRVRKDEISQSARSDATLKEALLQNGSCCGLHLHRGNKQSLSALRNKPRGIEHERVNSVVEVVQSQHCILEVTPAIRAQKTRDIFNEQKRRAPLLHPMQNLDEAPKSRGVLTLQSFAPAGER